MFFVGSDVYDNDSVELLCGFKDVDAVIIGDLFCNKRMFGSDIQLIKSAEAFHNAGIKVCFQSPMYLTSRCFSSVAEKIEYLCKNNICDTVILQNMGLLRSIRNKIPTVKFLWNCIELGRSRVSNSMYYMTIMELGADGFLTDNIPAAAELNKRSIPVIPIYGKMAYSSMNRECYYMHEHNIFDGNCRRGCLDKTDFLVNESGSMRMSIDGHLLGRHYVYENTVEIGRLYREYNTDICVFSEQLSNLPDRINEVKLAGMEYVHD